MSPIVVFKASIIAFILLLPGCVFSFAIFKNRLSVLTHFILGLAAGLVILINLNVLISFLGGIARGSLVVGLLILYLASFGLLVMRRPWPRGSDASSLKSLENLILIAVIGWSLIVRSIPLLFSEYPLGWDSSFHSLIAKIIAITQHIPDSWQPFERIPLNYTWGSHVFVNAVSLFSGIEIHQVFAVLNSVFFGALSVAAVYMLARLFYDDKLPAVMAAAAYGLLVNWGSLNYLAWGGLPNQIGMFLFLCVSYVLLEKEIESSKKVIIGGLLLSGVILVHNHSMLVSLIVLLSYVFTVLFAKRRFSKEVRVVLAAILVSFLFSSYYSWRLFLHVSKGGNGGLFRFKEILNIFDVTSYLGLFLTVLFAIGFFSYVGKKENERSIYLYSWLVSLFAAFALFYYVWKIGTKLLIGETFVALTPSRFITDLGYPAAILAGQGAFVILRSLKARSGVLVGMLVASLLLSPFYYTVGLYKPAISTDVIKALSWVRENTSKDSLIINSDPKFLIDDRPKTIWVPYISEREATLTPLPITELSDARMSTIKPSFVNYVLRGKGWQDYERSNISKYFENRPIYVYTNRNFNDDFLIRVYSVGRIKIYRVSKPFWETK